MLLRFVAVFRTMERTAGMPPVTYLLPSGGVGLGMVIASGAWDMRHLDAGSRFGVRGTAVRIGAQATPGRGTFAIAAVFGVSKGPAGSHRSAHRRVSGGCTEDASARSGGEPDPTQDSSIPHRGCGQFPSAKMVQAAAPPRSQPSQVVNPWRSRVHSREMMKNDTEA